MGYLKDVTCDLEKSDQIVKMLDAGKFELVNWLRSFLPADMSTIQISNRYLLS